MTSCNNKAQYHQNEITCDGHYYFIDGCCCKEALISETWILHTRSTMTAQKIDRNRNLSNIALIRLLLPEQLWAIEAWSP